MRIEIHYFAEDDTEFDTEEECKAYEQSLWDNFDSVVFFDDHFNIMNRERNSISGIADLAWYIEILDGEKAERLFKWLYSFAGMCTDGLTDLVAGDIYAWDNTDSVWYSPKKKLREWQKIVDAIEKAVNSLG